MIILLILCFKSIKWLIQAFLEQNNKLSIAPRSKGSQSSSPGRKKQKLSSETHLSLGNFHPFRHGELLCELSLSKATDNLLFYSRNSRINNNL